MLLIATTMVRLTTNDRRRSVCSKGRCVMSVHTNSVSRRGSGRELVPSARCCQGSMSGEIVFKVRNKNQDSNNVVLPFSKEENARV